MNRAELTSCLHGKDVAVTHRIYLRMVSYRCNYSKIV